MDESKTLDLVDVVKSRLEGAGIRDVFTYLPDARRHAEFCAIRTGVPGGEDSYFNLAFDTAIRLSLLFARRVELDAMGDALLAERTLRTVPLEQAFYWRSAVCWGFAAVVMVTGGCQWLVSCIKHPA